MSVSLIQPTYLYECAGYGCLSSAFFGRPSLVTINIRMVEV